MAAHHIIPIRVIDLQLDKDEMLRRGMKDKMKANRSDSWSESRCSLLYVCGAWWKHAEQILVRILPLIGVKAMVFNKKVNKLTYKNVMV